MAYSEEELIEELKRVSEEHCDGEAPTWREFEEFGSCHPETVLNKFDGWNKAIGKIGTEPNQRGPSLDFSREDFILSIKSVSEKYCDGKIPRTKDINNYCDFHIRTLEKRFVTYGEFVSEIDFEKNIKYPKPTDKEVERELNRLLEEHDHHPTMTIVRKHSSLTPQSLCYRYGMGWSGILDKFDFEEVDGIYRDYPSGEEHHWWKEGTTHKYGSSWLEQREKVIKRDGNRCRVCRVDVVEQWKKTPSVHHITPRRYWDVDAEHEEMNREGNLISLCPSCHQKLEGKFMGREYEEFERLSKEYLEVRFDSIFDY